MTRPRGTQAAHPDAVFKLCQPEQWATLQAAGRWAGSPDDLRDGFIHLSTGAQLQGTLARYFDGAPGTVLLRLSAAALGPALRWEPSRGGQLFPHLYCDLTLGGIEVSLVLTAGTLPETLP